MDIITTKSTIEKRLFNYAKSSMEMFCTQISGRSVGSAGNKQAIQFFEKEMRSKGWETRMPEFNVIDWHNEGTKLLVNDLDFNVFASPYSLGCNVKGVLINASSVKDLEINLNGNNKIILLHGDLAKEQIMPKNFIFYNPEEHQEIIKWLEKSGVEAIISAKHGSIAVPMFEDGDFDIPSVYMTGEEVEKLLQFVGQEVTLESKSFRTPSKARNVIAKNKRENGSRLVVTAHVDCKQGSPGALDNATGITTLLLLADLLADYQGKVIELVAFNGEDYYSIPGQMNYMKENQGDFENIDLNINIDGVGYLDGKTAFSFFGLSNDFKAKVYQVMSQFPEIEEGIQWRQGDHSMFIQAGRPAIAITSQWILNNMYTQNITHSEYDNLTIIAYDRLVETALAIDSLIRSL